MADDKPIIVIKKKGGHGGHHGGAWKIAYADFVTAMMAFFMVMWLLSAAESNVKKSISSYFRRPGIFQEGSGTPLMIGASGILTEGVPPSEYRGTQEVNGNIQAPPKSEEPSKAENLAEEIDLKIKELKKILEEMKKAGNAAAGDALEKLDQAAAEQKTEVEKLNEVAEQVKQQILSSPELKELLGAVDVKVDADGLTIEIMDTQMSSMFASGSATIMPDAAAAFTKLAGILNTVPNKIDILGHTDATPYRSRTGSYSNWELSADRANAARKLLEAQGLDVGRIESVIGRADTELKNKDVPTDASNRRITLKIRFSKVSDIKATDVPNILKELPALQDKYQKMTVPTAGTVAPENPVHSLTVEDVLSEAKLKNEEKKKAIEEKAKKDVEIEKGLIFKENPVLGPAEFFDR
jgi:chemotaxis protein MotB